jgi:hypothetical protein
MKGSMLAPALLIISLLFGGLSGCEKQEGPAEKAGKALDEAASDIRDAAEEAKEEIEDRLDD